MSVLDKSGLQKLWSNLKSFFATKEEISDFVSKSDSSDVYGSNNMDDSGQVYYPGLVPAAIPLDKNKYLKSDGTWALPFSIDAGQVTITNIGAKTISCSLKKKYIKVYESSGALVISSLVSGTDITSVCSRIGNISSVTDSDFTIFIGAASSGTTFYWEVYGEK